MRALGFVGILALACVAGACNPYNPSLGKKPFCCGTDPPKCPDGYGAVDTTDTSCGTLCECVEGATNTESDAAPGQTIDAATSKVVCNDDSVVTGDPGGDETTSSATMTSVGPAGSWRQRNLAICPPADVDVFALPITQAATTITAKVQLNVPDGLLTIEILDSTGQTKATGALSGNQVIASHTALSIGVYYVRVRASSPGTQNNYHIEVVLSG